MAEATGLVTATPLPIPVRIARMAWRMRRLPLIPMFILAVFLVTGIFAPLIAPHNPERGDIRARNVPPVWVGDDIQVKLVVQAVAIGEGSSQISLRDAGRKTKGAVVGDEVDVLIKEGGSTKYLLGPTTRAGTCLAAQSMGPRFLWPLWQWSCS